MLKPATGTQAAVRVAIFALVVASFGVAVSGCASNESYNNDPKPPATRTVTVVVGEDDISASPNDFGAGPTRFITVNTTGVLQEVTYASDRVERTVRVDAKQTANFKMNTEPGYFTIDASDSAANTLEIEVGPKRPTAQQDLNQP